MAQLNNYLSPVYNVKRVPINKIQANDYNPNTIAPTELKLLEQSIFADGYTMPIVCYYFEEKDCYEIVDGYHRFLVMKNSDKIAKREEYHLPVVVIDKPVSDRIASTIRHNRARGTHSIDAMVEIVRNLTEAGLSDEWIIKNIGMDKNELLRLKQISGLAILFKEREFTQAWEDI
ncbi:ParB-like nuclease domain-containing protein [Enterococcus faecalis]|nr:ParB-like nuclease domain-containing protein [Enterococcus faecalis]